MTEQQLETVAWLNRAYHTAKKVKAIAAQRDELRTLAQCVGGSAAGNDKGKSDGRKNGTENALIRVLGMDEKLDAEVKQLLREYDEISAAIKSIPDADMQVILMRRYLAFQTMEQIANEMHYGMTTVKRKYKAAISKLAHFGLV